jgi:hypothetical protein
MTDDQTWTFVGLWEGNKIAVEYAIPGVVEDTLALKALAIRAIELYPTATHLFLDDCDQFMTAVTGRELYAGDDELDEDWEGDDDLNDLVHFLDSEQMTELECVTETTNGNSRLWELRLAAASVLPMRPFAEPEIVLRGEFPPMPDPATQPSESEHEAFHRRSLLPIPSVLCATCGGEQA